VGLVGYRFNTIGVSDGISMGTGEPAAADVALTWRAELNLWENRSMRQNARALAPAARLPRLNVRNGSHADASHAHVQGQPCVSLPALRPRADGMSFSLQSRDLIADSIETVMSAQVGPGAGAGCRLQGRMTWPCMVPESDNGMQLAWGGQSYHAAAC
jgi:hypothetical protein